MSEPSIQLNANEIETKFTFWSKIVKKWGPLLGFVGGVGWDTWTLGKVVTELDLYILGAYLVLAFVCTLLFNRNWEKWGILGYHFCSGTLLSAMVILFAKSASSFGSILLVSCVGVLMIFNEFWGENKFDQQLRNILLWLVTTMYLQFLLPHLFKSISTLWVFIALGLSALISLGLAKIQKTLIKKWLIPISILWVLLWIFNFFPPIPLVLKDQYVGSDLISQDYSVENRLESHFFSPNKVVLQQGERLVYLSSVFAPKDVSANLEHRYYYQGPQGDKKLIDTIALRLRKGGREQGWRFYSYKQNMMEGKWWVQTAVEDGPVISTVQFDFKFGEPLTSGRVQLD